MGLSVNPEVFTDYFSITPVQEGDEPLAVHCQVAARLHDPLALVVLPPSHLELLKRHPP